MANLPQYWSIFTDNNSNIKDLLYNVKQKRFPEVFNFLLNLNGVLFSKNTINTFIEKEEKHNQKIVNKNSEKALKHLSSGEQKIILLEYFLEQEFEYLILDNVFDSLDRFHREKFTSIIKKIALTTTIIQITSRKNDLLSFINNFTVLKKSNLIIVDDYTFVDKLTEERFSNSIPKPITARTKKFSKLVAFNNASISYLENKILNNINWEIKQNEFWQLTGENGSGKSTLISLITGDNPKAYGLNLILFDKLRGSGESVWDIKNKICYFTPSMVFNFKGHHTILQMIISGIRDSIGLYIKPSEIEKQKAMEWLEFLNLTHLKNSNFNTISKGNQRLIMLVRAFIKWPY